MRRTTPRTVSGALAAGRLLLALWVALAGASLLKAESLHVTYRFGEPGVERGKLFDRVGVDALPCSGEPGAPLLPRRVGCILVPRGFTVEKVVVQHDEPQTVPGSYLIEPATLEVSPVDGRVSEEPTPDPNVYGSPGPYPPLFGSEEGRGRKHGREVVFIGLSPVIYRPLAGELRYVRRMDVQVQLRPDPDGMKMPAPRVTPPLLQELSESVDNPGDLAREAGAERVLKSTWPPEGAGAGADDVAYAVVTTAELAPFFEPLVEARTAGGLQAAVFTMEWIRSGYDGLRPDGGVDDATRLRNFIRDYYLQHGLRYVLLGGDADGMTGCPECEPVGVPTRYFQSSALFVQPIPADMYFGCLDGTFDGDGDGVYGEPDDGEDGGDVDFLFEVHVGRAPVDSPAEASRFVAKTLGYDESSGLILREVLLVGEHLGFGGLYNWGGNLNDRIRTGSSLYIDTVGFDTSPYDDFFHIQSLYDRDVAGGWTPAALVERLERGVHIVNHVGHADASTIMKLRNEDIDALSNEHPFLGYSQSCYAGAFDNQETNGQYGPDCVVEHLLGSASGAVAFVANSRRGWAGSQVPDGPSQRFNRRFWHVIFDQGILQWGVANDRSKEESLGDILVSDRARWCAYELNTLGDPALTLKFASRRGSLAFDRPWYHVGETAGLTLTDADLNLSPDLIDTARVVLSAPSTGDEHALDLLENGRSSGVFLGNVDLLATVGDGLMVSPPDTIRAAYEDADNGHGEGVIVLATAQVTAPLEFAGECPGEGAIGVPYEATLAAEGGMPPYRFSSEEGYVESLGPSHFEGLGVRQNWQSDDGAWTYALPFEFPFYGQYYSSIVVSSNGYIDLDEGGGLDFDNSVYRLTARKRIAVCWADLVTANGGDVYINEKLGSVTVRWRATGYHTHEESNFEAELFEDGTIRFGFGSGNRDLSPTIGISAGDRERYMVSQLSGGEDLSRAPAAHFFPTRLPDGLEVEEATGLITGFPTEVGLHDVSLRVEDLNGQVARSQCTLVISSDGLILEAPQGGELWLRGSQQTIRWQWFGNVGSHVRLDYNTDGSTSDFPFSVAASVPTAERAFTWSLPESPEEQVRIRIQSVQFPELFTYGETFSIVDPSILLETPNGGERWITGASATVSWQSIGSTGSRVRILYSADGSDVDFPHTLAGDVPNTGRYELVVPDTPSETCRVLVESLASPEIRAVSREVFAIRQPSITLTYPNGGECLRAGEEITVNWFFDGNVGDQVHLEFNLDGSPDSFPFRVSDTPLPNTGSATWTLPAVLVPEARLRVRAYPGFRYADMSDSPFSLSRRCSLRVLLWVPYISVDEEQVVGTLEVLEQQDDLEVYLSTTTTPALLQTELDDKDACIVAKQKQAPQVDFEALGVELAPVLLAYLARGGCVVTCEQVPESEAFVRALNLLDFQSIGEGVTLCEVASPFHPLVQGVRPNFAGPLRTAWYDMRGFGVEPVVHGGTGGVVVACREYGFGRLSFLGFDYYSTNSDTSSILLNAVYRDVPGSGVRLLEPAPGRTFFEGEPIRIQWVARGEAQGPVVLSYGEQASGSEFPYPIAEVTPSDPRMGAFDWTAPSIPPDRVFLPIRLKVESRVAPRHSDVLPEPLLVLAPLVIETEVLPEGSVGLPYQAAVRVRGGVPPYEFTINGLPAGLVSRQTGDSALEIAGVPQGPCEACEVEVVVRDTTGLVDRTVLFLDVYVRGIELLHPRGGELWLYGSTQEIRWTSLGDVGETVSLSFNTDGSRVEFPFLIEDSLPIENGLHEWHLPTLDAADCRLKIQSNERPEFFAVSGGVFSIVGPSIRIDVPDGGECWAPGKEKKILWRSASNQGETIRIEYNTDGSTSDFPLLLAEGIPDTGEFTWLVDAVPAESCRMRLRFVENPAVEDVSEAPFRIARDCHLSGLFWVPFLSLVGNRAVMQEAIEGRETDFTADFTRARSAGVLESALANRDVLMVLLMDAPSASDCAALGADTAGVLAQYVEGGGVVVLCGAGRRGVAFLEAAGLFDECSVVTSAEWLSCHVVSYLHPIAQWAPFEFVVPTRSCSYEVAGAGWEEIVHDMNGDPVVLSRDQGRGRWVLLGFGFEQRDVPSGEILASAVRARAALPGLRLLSPPSGSVYLSGEAVPVEWAARGSHSGAVEVFYNRNGSTVEFPHFAGEVLADETGGSFLWTAPAPPTGDHYPCRMQIRWKDAPDLQARSESPFHVVGQPLTVETEVLPDGFQNAEYQTEVTASGGALPYTFEATGLHAGLVLVSPEPGSRSATLMGSPLETGTDRPVTMIVRDSLGLETQRSLTLNIFPSWIEILSPQGGDYLLAGSTHEVRWRVHGYAGETFRLEYNLDGSLHRFEHVAAESVPVASSFQWHLPDVESPTVRLRISSHEIPSLGSVGERTFAISRPGVTCLYPNGGERLETGTRRTLRWRSLGNPGSTVSIHLDLHGGLDDYPITLEQEVPDTGQYKWQVPETVSASCRVRVGFHEDPQKRDVSDAAFSICRRAAVHGLVWIPYASFDDAEVRGAIAATTLYEHDFDWVLSKSLQDSRIQSELYGMETFLMVQQRGAEANFRALGRALGPVLREFVLHGGTLVVLKQLGSSMDFLPATGLLELRQIGQAWNESCRVVWPEHPVVNQVPAAFHPSAATAWYDIEGEDVEVYATSSGGHPVVAGRNLGDGRVVLIGFDYRDYSESSARVLANAVRNTPFVERTRFVRGDANSSGKVDIADAIFILNYLFKGGPEPVCFDAADVDDSARVDSSLSPIDLSDPLLLIDWLLLGGSPLPPPTPLGVRAAPASCGPDPQFRDGLECEAYWPCEG